MTKTSKLLKILRYWGLKETGTSYNQRFGLTGNQWQNILQKVRKLSKNCTRPENFDICFCQKLIFEGRLNTSVSSTQFWDILFISYFPKIPTLKSFGNLWGNSYAKLIILDIKFCFTLSELNYHRSTLNSKTIM